MERDGGTDAVIGPPVEPEYLRTAYANQVNVNHTPYDFRLVFSLLEVPTQTPPADAEGKVVLRPTAVASVVIPATVMHGFISALNTQFSDYMKQFGPPGLDPTGPGGMDQ